MSRFSIPQIAMKNAVLRPFSDVPLPDLTAWIDNADPAFRRWDVRDLSGQSYTMWQPARAGVMVYDSCKKAIADVLVLRDVADEKHYEISVNLAIPELDDAIVSAMQGLLDHLFKNANGHRVRALVAVDHRLLCALWTDLGLQAEARLRQHFRYPDGWKDEYVFAKVVASSK